MEDGENVKTQFIVFTAHQPMQTSIVVEKKQTSEDRKLGRLFLRATFSDVADNRSSNQHQLCDIVIRYPHGQTTARKSIWI